MLSAIIVDLDQIFNSLCLLREKLAELLPAHLQPNLIVCYSAGGVIERPHLIWLLPPGSEVWNDLSDPRCKEKHIQLYHQTHRALICRLLPIGADPGQTANPYKCKNPLSPFWSTFVLNERWNTLKEILAPLVKVGEEQLFAEAAAQHNGCEYQQSMNLWRMVGNITREICRQGRNLGDDDPEYAAVLEKKDAAALETLIKRRTVERLCEIWDEVDDDVLRIVGKRSPFAAKAAIKSEKTVCRGRDAAAIKFLEGKEGVKLTVKERRQWAQRLTNRCMRESIVDAIARAIAAAIAAGEDCNARGFRAKIAARVASAGACGQSTVFKPDVWEKAVSESAKFSHGVDI